ncbi:uncharacterized protein B0J16DRAFT_258165 [Fusarium flagelliforme]|uniref:Uncharacterized protein n=1 Tax=Fusarium flagelliforme TaxID=2675880 RepID=A0A395N2N8_9HYPO|nr:uncharacterized protein B0J16DRAFT_258165 [Fusarium flagelliforme]KAH7198705.1 hypothetical protein B0J16DRAFT_258165 [Fusarium flagelliforme]RFN54073.1 hypothetical protein FIE12Z_1562 [Fusarium flagelliforme]
MPKERKFRKADPKSLEKKSKSSRFNNLETHSDTLDTIRSHKKKRQLKHEEPLKSMRTALFHILNDRWTGKRKRQLSTESQKFCSRVGNIYTKALELALEMGNTNEDVEMEWQHELTKHVHIVRTREEEASYPDGVVVSPWETETSTTYRSVLNEPNCGQSSSSIEDKTG